MATDERDESLLRAIELAGGPAALARFITALDGQEPITAQAICDWKRCPPKRVIAVERATQVDGKPLVGRHELRPDLYPLEQAA